MIVKIDSKNKIKYGLQKFRELSSNKLFYSLFRTMFKLTENRKII